MNYYRQINTIKTSIINTSKLVRQGWNSTAAEWRDSRRSRFEVDHVEPIIRSSLRIADKMNDHCQVVRELHQENYL